MKNINVFWITSYPKSGNTWVNWVLRIAGAQYGFPKSDMDIYNIMRNKTVPEPCSVLKDTVTLEKCAILKTHGAYPGREQRMHVRSGFDFLNKGYVHIYRNPLDVLLSYINFTRLQYGAWRDDTPASQSYRKNIFKLLLNLDREYSYEEWSKVTLDDIPQKNLDHALDYFSDKNLDITTLHEMSNSWLNHTLSWLAAKDDMPGVSIRYEDCLKDDSVIVGLNQFFKMSEEEMQSALNTVNASAKNCSVSKEASHHDKVFFNKMRAYYFKEYFSASAIKRFLKCHEETLIALKYHDLLEMI